MIPNGSVEQGLLHVRINELERRLARLEQQMTEVSPEATPASPEADEVSPEATPASPEADEATPDAAPTPGMDARPGGGADPRNGAPEIDDPGEELEGARLVAIELLSSGYARHEVASYLSSTFGIADAEAVIPGAGPVPG